jgi:hypothetical protein
VEDKNSNMRILNISRIDDLVANSMNILEPDPVDADGNAREDGTCLSLFHRWICSFHLLPNTLILLLEDLAVKDVPNFHKHCLTSKFKFESS